MGTWSLRLGNPTSSLFPESQNQWEFGQVVSLVLLESVITRFLKAVVYKCNLCMPQRVRDPLKSDIQ